MPEKTDSLEDQMADFERDRHYTTKALVKESPAERTELVVDAQGVQHVRKYLDAPEEGLHPYERLAGKKLAWMPRVEEAFRYGGKVVAVIEYIEGKTLREHVAENGPLAVGEATDLMSKLLDALQTLHTFDGGCIVHRDVNPNNIIVNDSDAYLIDLGIARNHREGAAQDTKLWGTEGYTAPEQFGFEQTDARADIYSAGMVLRFMLTGADPKDQGVPVPSTAAYAVKRATQMDPARRYRSARAFAQALPPVFSRERQKEEASAHTRAARLTGITKRSKPVLLLWRAWQMFVWFCVACVLVSICADSVRSANPYVAFYNGIMLMTIAVLPAVFLTDFANLYERVPPFRAHRFVWAFVLAFASLALCIVLVSIGMIVSPGFEAAVRTTP